MSTGNNLTRYLWPAEHRVIRHERRTLRGDLRRLWLWIREYEIPLLIAVIIVSTAAVLTMMTYQSWQTGELIRACQVRR